MRHGPDEPVYYIGVVARLVSCHPQTLRMYERVGLVEPKRTPQGARLYSENDLERLRQIQRLTQDMGVNLAGVEVVLNLLNEIERLNAEIKRLRRDIEQGPPALNPAPTQRRRIEIGIDGE